MMEINEVLPVEHRYSEKRDVIIGLEMCIAKVLSVVLGDGFCYVVGTMYLCKGQSSCTCTFSSKRGFESIHA